MISTSEDVATLVRQAGNGNRQAWTELVDAYGGLIYSIARSHRLGDADATDVCQTTWMRLLEHIDRLDDPSRVGAWLATTARRECLRILRLSARQTLTSEETDLEPRTVTHIDLDTGVITSERDAVLNLAVDRLSPKCAQLMRLLMSEDAPSYSELSERLGIPIGSIGPTRARALAKLRVILAELDPELMATVRV